MGHRIEERSDDMVCREVYNLLPDYSAEALPRRRMEQIRAHLIGCPDCSREWAGLRETLRLVEECSPLVPPPGLWQGVLAGIGETGEREGDRATRRQGEGVDLGFAPRRPVALPVGRAAPSGPQPRRSHGWPWEFPRFRVAGAWGLASGVVLAAVLVTAFWSFRDRPLTPPPPVASVVISDPELVAAVQQHSFASSDLLFADRAGLESVVQLVRHQRQP